MDAEGEAEATQRQEHGDEGGKGPAKPLPGCVEEHMVVDGHADDAPQTAHGHDSRLALALVAAVHALAHERRHRSVDDQDPCHLENVGEVGPVAAATTVNGPYSAMEMAQSPCPKVIDQRTPILGSSVNIQAEKKIPKPTPTSSGSIVSSTENPTKMR
eukprot:CAMPEP_0175625086 /NCGR_PEP_ID=MMETSP0096-20121207/70289_1 /TAXON_ID=311494 /ORGANISM="Alexandrium monilatum, Strain CCMP3105" /LENGTH=157 /DNA_ID=CAMNT_0016930415 /DNA_START=156 /DNA_END=630 /DNA_ORIENTATION=+